MKILETKEKRCRGKCPMCNSKDIMWSDYDVYVNSISYRGICNDCACELKEEYNLIYNGTTY